MPGDKLRWISPKHRFTENRMVRFFTNMYTRPYDVLAKLDIYIDGESGTYPVPVLRIEGYVV